MKTVVSSEMVAHLWVHQSQSEARNGTGSLYFRDSTIWSYGSHFPIARHVNGVVLQTTDRCSMTTSTKHQPVVRQACSHLTVYNVPDVLADTPAQHAENLADYQKRYETALLKASRARSNADWHIETAAELFTKGNAYAECFEIPERMTERDTAELIERAKAHTAARREANKRRAEARREQLDTEWQEFQEALPAWRTGLAPLPRLSYDNPHKPKGALLRVIGDTVKTSQGAEFPVSAAPLAWRIVKRCKDTGTAWQSNGEQVRLGHFRLDSVDTAGNVRAGCHYVEYAECEGLARTLNLAE